MPVRVRVRGNLQLELKFCFCLSSHTWALDPFPNSSSLYRPCVEACNSTDGTATLKVVDSEGPDLLHGSSRVRIGYSVCVRSKSAAGVGEAEAGRGGEGSVPGDCVLSLPQALLLGS